MKVKNIMTQPLQTCTIDMNLAAASRRMKETGSGTLAVLNHRGRLAGIVTDRDLALAIGNIRDPALIAVAKLMTRSVHTCGPNDDVHSALDTMSMFKVRRLPVVSPAGNVEGMISIIILWGVPKSCRQSARPGCRVAIDLQRGCTPGVRRIVSHVSCTTELQMASTITAA